MAASQSWQGATTTRHFFRPKPAPPGEVPVRHLPVSIAPEAHAQWQWRQRSLSLIGRLMPARFSPANRQRRRRSLIGQLKMPARHSPANRRRLLSGSGSGGGDAPRWSVHIRDVDQIPLFMHRVYIWYRDRKIEWISSKQACCLGRYPSLRYPYGRRLCTGV